MFEHLKIKQRIVCPKCARGVLIRDMEPYNLDRGTLFIPHCNSTPFCNYCGQNYKVRFNTKDMEMEIEEA